MQTDSTITVVHVIYRLGIGGLENGLVNLINGSPRSIRHVIVCLAGYTDFAERIQRDDTRIIDLEKRPGRDFRSYWRFWRLLREIRPDVVHTRNFAALDYQFVAALAGCRARIHGEHGWYVSDVNGTSGRQLLMRRAARLVVTQYTTVSRHMALWMQNVIGIPPGKIAQIYNGIDVSRFSPSGRSRSGEPVFHIGTVGRLDPIKDQGRLIEAVAILVKDNPSRSIRVSIVGDGPLMQDLQERARKLGCEEAVSLPGATDDVPGAMNGFDVFVLPSLNEGISNTILEAMASGLPVLASDVGGNPELVVEGTTGFLFEAGNTAALVAALEKSMTDPEWRESAGSAGRERAATKFAPGKMVSKYVHEYQRASSGLRRLVRTEG